MSHLPFVSDAHLLAIGHVAIRSSQLEHMIEYFLAHAFRPHFKSAELLLKNWNANRSLELIEATLIDQYPAQKRQVQLLVKSISAARSERNSIMHFVWGKADKEGAAKLASFRPFREMTTKEMTAKEVDKVALDLLEATTNIQKIMDWMTAQKETRHNPFGGLLQFPHPPWPVSLDLPEPKKSRRQRLPARKSKRKAKSA